MFPKQITQTERCCSKAETSEKSPERQHWEKVRTAGVRLEELRDSLERGASEEAVRPSASTHAPYAGDSAQRSTPTVTPKQQIQSNHLTHSCWEREDRRLIPLVKGLLVWQITFVLMDEPAENILTYDY